MPLVSAGDVPWAWHSSCALYARSKDCCFGLLPAAWPGLRWYGNIHRLLVCFPLSHPLPPTLGGTSRCEPTFSSICGVRMLQVIAAARYGWPSAQGPPLVMPPSLLRLHGSWDPTAWRAAARSALRKPPGTGVSEDACGHSAAASCKQFLAQRLVSPRCCQATLLAHDKECLPVTQFCCHAPARWRHLSTDGALHLGIS